MVLLVERFHKLYAKLENHHHHHRNHQHQAEALSASLQDFQSDVSNFVNQLASNSKPGSEILSLPWIQQCFQLIPMIGKAFAKLSVDIDYPASKWKAKSMDGYMKYSLDLLDLLNNISSSLACLRQARLEMSHALSLFENSPASAVEHLNAIEFKHLSKDFKDQERVDEDEKERFSPDQEWIINQALTELKSIVFWICGVVLAGLSGNAKAHEKMRKTAGALSSNSSLIYLDSSVSGHVMEKGYMLKEVKELKDAAACLAADVATEKRSVAVEDMQRRLEVFEKQLDGLEQEVNCLFSVVLAGRSELLNGIRHPKQPQK